MKPTITGTAQRPGAVLPKGAPIGLDFKALSPHSLGPEECKARCDFAVKTMREELVKAGQPHDIVEHRLKKLSRNFMRKFLRRR